MPTPIAQVPVRDKESTEAEKSYFSTSIRVASTNLLIISANSALIC